MKWVKLSDTQINSLVDAILDSKRYLDEGIKSYDPEKHSRIITNLGKEIKTLNSVLALIAVTKKKDSIALELTKAELVYVKDALEFDKEETEASLKNTDDPSWIGYESTIKKWKKDIKAIDKILKRIQKIKGVV